MYNDKINIAHLKVIVKNTVIRNSIWLYILQIFNSIVPLVTLPYITRILGKEHFGIFSFSLNIIEYFIVIVEYGFNYSGTRKIALVKNENEVRDFFVTILISKLILMLFCFGVLHIFLYFYPMEFIQKISCYVLFLSVFGTAFQQTWLFQGLQKVYYITLINIISRIISLCFIFVYVHTENDLLIYCLFYSITPLLTGITGMIFAIKLLMPISWKLHFCNIITEIKTGWYTFTTSLSSKIFSAMGITILGIVSTKEQVGIYSAIHKIPSILLLIWIPISQVLYPISSKKMKNNPKDGLCFIKTISKYIGLFFIVISIIISIFSKPVIALAFGYEYAEYYYILFPLILWLNIGIWNNFLGIQTLLAGGFDRTYSKCFQISVVITIVLNIILINSFDIIGAAITPLLSEIILFILLLLAVRKIKTEQNIKQKTDKK